MAFEVVDALYYILELIFRWRLWLPLAIAGGVAMLLHLYLPEFEGRSAALTVIVAAGFVSGFYWQHRHEECHKEL